MSLQVNLLSNGDELISMDKEFSDYNSNHASLKKLSNDLKTLLGVPSRISSKIIYSIYLIGLHKVMEQSLDTESGLPDSVSISLPYYGDLIIHKSGLGSNKSLSYEFKPLEYFDNDAKNAMFNGISKLTDYASENLKDSILKKYRDLI